MDSILETAMVRKDSGDDCEASLSGRITIDSAPELRTLLLRPLQSPNLKRLTVDLFDVKYMDTSGLAVLLEILKAARVNGKSFYLRRLRDQARNLLEGTRLLHLFDEVDAS
jgi:anti-sigma B factor antagonist